MRSDSTTSSNNVINAWGLGVLQVARLIAIKHKNLVTSALASRVVTCVLTVVTELAQKTTLYSGRESYLDDKLQPEALVHDASQVVCSRAATLVCQ